MTECCALQHNAGIAVEVGNKTGNRTDDNDGEESGGAASVHGVDGDTGNHDFDDEETNKIDNSAASSVLAEQATTEQPMLPTANFIRMAHQAAMQPHFVLPTMMPTVMLPPMIMLEPLKNGWGMATGHHNNCNQSQQKTKRKRSRRSCKCGNSRCNGGFNRAWCKNEI